VDVWALGICLYILLSGIHPFQIEDEDQMLDNIEDGVWRWLGPNWDSISDNGKDLIKHMMDPNPQQRWTINHCLESEWIKGHAPDVELETVKDEIKSFQAKKRLKGAILGVMASNKMKSLMSSFKKGADGAPAPVADKKVNKIQTERQPAQVASSADFEHLKVEVVSGKNLAPKDANGKSDPYLRVFCGPFKYKTKVVKKSLDPVWSDESFQIPATTAKVNQVTIECWDWDVIGTDDFMGEFSFGLQGSSAIDLAPGATQTITFPLQKPKQKSMKKTGAVSGSITLNITKAVN